MQLTTPALMNRLDSEADAYLLLEELRWHGSWRRGGPNPLHLGLASFEDAVGRRAET